MSTQLELIATTPVMQRKIVMPRIQCKDGASLSVQATSRHYTVPRKSDEGPWTSLECAFFSSGKAPRTWQQYFVENHSSADELHDTTGTNYEGNPFAFNVFTVPVEIIKAYIDQHGGEIETQGAGV